MFKWHFNLSHAQTRHVVSLHSQCVLLQPSDPQTHANVRGLAHNPVWQMNVAASAPFGSSGAIHVTVDAYMLYRLL